MKLNRLFFAALAAAGLAASCNDDGYWDEAQDQGLTYSFTSTSQSYTYAPADEMTDIEVTVNRSTTKGTATLPIAAAFSDEALVNGPDSVQFADGSATAIYTIHLVKQFEIGESATVNLTINPSSLGIAAVEYPDPLSDDATAEDSTAYTTQLNAYNAYVSKLAEYKLSTTITIAKEYDWVSIGTGHFADAFLFGDTYEVEYQQCVQDPTMYRLVDPYSEGLEEEGYVDEGDVVNGPSEYVVFKLLQPGDVIDDSITITMNDLVYFQPYMTGYYSSNYSAEVWALHPSARPNTAAEAYFTHNRVESYQADGTPGIVQFAPRYWMYGVGGWNYSQYDGVVTLTFPGVQIMDYSGSISYAGLYTDLEGTQYALGDVTLGSDVAYARAVLVEGKDNVNDAYAGIADGSLEYVEVTEDGQVQLAVPADAATGKYTLVLFTYDSTGEIQEYDYSTFDYRGYGPAETWTARYVGDYVYTLYFGSEDEPYNDEGLTLYQSDSDETRFKIEHWGYDVDFAFTMQADGSIVVDDQETGYTHSSYGAVMVDDLTDYTGSTAYGTSSYDASTGTFSFALVYYVSAGAFNYGTETYTVTDAATKERIAKAIEAAKAKKNRTLNVQAKRPSKRQNVVLRSCKKVEK